METHWEIFRMNKMPVQKRPPRTEEQIDETIDESFPASDPPSYSRTARSGAPPRGEKLNQVPCEEEGAGKAHDDEADKEKDSKE